MIGPSAKLTILSLAWSIALFGATVKVAWAGLDEVTILETRLLAQNSSSLRLVEKRLTAPSIGEFKITVVVVDPKKYFLKLVVPSNASNGSSLGRFLFDEEALAIISAGFLRTYSPTSPAGLVKFGGATTNTLSMTDPALGGVICFSRSGHEMKIAVRSDADLISRSDDCIQAGPLLISDGSVHDEFEKIDAEYTAFSSRKYIRAFLAKTKRGEILLGYSSPTSLSALRNVLLMPESAGGFEANAAIGLTGGASAGLIFKGADAGQSFALGASTATLLPNALAVKPEPR